MSSAASLLPLLHWVIIFLSLNFVIATTENKPSSLPKRSTDIAPSMCIPHTNMRFECFNCTCDSNGMQVNCEPLQECISSIRYFKEGIPIRRCIPNFRALFNCNSCSCSANGMLVKCKREPHCHLKGLTRAQRCYPNSETEIQCVTCKCSSDGTTIRCNARKNCEFRTYEEDKKF